MTCRGGAQPINLGALSGRVDQRVPKKLLLENGAPTAADKRVISDGIKDLLWLAALKPTTIGVPAYRDDVREYLEITVLRLTLRASAKATRLVVLVHRAVPYPLLLLTEQGARPGLSAAHKRWSQGAAGETVLDGDPQMAQIGADEDKGKHLLESASSADDDFLRALALGKQPQAHLFALYQDCIDTLLALQAARVTGAFAVAATAEHASARRDALQECARLDAAITRLCAQASKKRQNADVAALVADIHAYATYYCAMALGAEQHPELNQAFHDLRELKVDVAYPFLLDLYHDYQQQRLIVDETLQVVRLVESYVFRRAICGIPTNSLNKTFASFTRSLKKDRYVESVQAAFLLLPSYRRFPTDEEFQRELTQRDLYHFPRRSYWLRKLENHGRKERVVVEEYTIEHIMPQNEALSPDWITELGPDWKRIQQTWLHTLGNLTLTGYNSEYSDSAFAAKRDLTDKQGNPVGFATSPLKLNKGLGQVQRWNEAAIQARACRLANEGIIVWHVPQLDADVLDAYRLRPVKAGHTYTIKDHPHLFAGTMRDLFEALREAVIALDPCVSEEFLKLYVAYKAETNFVDVVPQAKRLRLSLNMPFHEIDDPKRMCKDVSGLGRWGNGDVEVGLSSSVDLPYVLGLIRQSFDHQMGDAAE